MALRAAGLRFSSMDQHGQFTNHTLSCDVEKAAMCDHIGCDTGP